MNIITKRTILSLYYEKNDKIPLGLILIPEFDNRNIIKNTLNEVMNDNRYIFGTEMTKINLLYIKLINMLDDIGIDSLNNIEFININNENPAVFDPIITGQVTLSETLFRIYNGGYTVSTPQEAYNHNYIPIIEADEEFNTPININIEKQTLMIVHDGYNILDIENVKGCELYEPDDFLKVCEYKETNLYKINPFRMRKDLTIRNFDVWMKKIPLDSKKEIEIERP